MRFWFVTLPCVVCASSGCAAIAGLDDLVRVDCVDCAGADAGPPRDAGISQKDVAAPVDAGPTHSIGGTVSGLAGSQIVLENNGSDGLVVMADGPFKFATRVAERAPYAVSVAMKPAGRNCTIANGSGIMGTMDVTSVAVACAAETYSVGGTVSGLTGTGLVLENNGRDDSTISANGAFTFPTTLANGAAYAVTVRAQPTNPSQTCTVSSATGNIAGANVSGVVVNCSSGSFTLGGTVTGLVGTGLVLQNNGANDLPVAANGSFSFSTPLTTGSTYGVTVRTQPSVFEQMCTVTNATGTIGAGNVSNVQVACGGVTAITLTGTGGQIPDGRNSCAMSDQGPSRTSDVVIPSSYFNVGDVTVTLTNLRHGFAGDLSAELRHVETMTTVPLFRNVDAAANSTCGSSAGFGGTYRFNDAFTGDLWSLPSMARTLAAGDYFCSGPSGTKMFLSTPAGFRGQGVAGTWRLTLVDSSSGDVGSLSGWTLRLVP